MLKQDPQQILCISEKFCSFVNVIVYLLGLPSFDYWKTNNPLIPLRDIMNVMKVRCKLLFPVCNFIFLEFYFIYIYLFLMKN